MRFTAQLLAAASILFSVAQQASSQSNSLEEILVAMEATVSNLAAQAAADYNTWKCGGTVEGAGLLDCVVSCGVKLQDSICTADLGEKNNFGGCEVDKDDRKAMMSNSNVRFATNPALYTGPGSTAHPYGSAYWTSGLDPKFVVNNQESGTLSWQYIGLANGVTRVYPGTIEGTCYEYDPRQRSWYVAASSGPKDVVLVVDTSGSMANHNRLELMKDAVKLVIGTLTMNDYFAVIDFNTAARILTNGGGTGLMQATQANKDAIVSKVESLEASGGTDFHEAFDVATTLLKARQLDYSSGCETAILFLTDGKDTSSSTADALADNINSLNGCGATNSTTSPCDSRIFSYTLGADADTVVSKAVSCASMGTWTPVVDNGDLRGQMASYYDFYASQRIFSVDETKVRWVEPYTDAFGAGMMTTASTAVYDESTTPPTLVGVVGIDLLLDDIKAVAESTGISLINALATRSQKCAKTDVVPGSCELARIREGTPTTTSALFSSTVDVSRLCTDDRTGCSERPEGVCLGTENDASRQTLSAACDGAFDVLSDATDESCCSSDASSGLSPGIIALIVVVVILVLCCCIGLIVWASKRPENKARRDGNQVVPVPAPVNVEEPPPVYGI